MLQIRMKKGIMMISCLFFVFNNCGGESCQDYFTFKSVRTVSKENIKELTERASKHEEILNEKIESADNLGIIYQQLGEKYLDRRVWNLAIESLEKAVGYGQDTSIVHYSLAIAYANRGQEVASDEDIRKAENHYKRALEITPNYYDASYGLGILLFYAKGDKEEGLKIIEGLIIKNRDYYRARFVLGRFYYELGRLNKSLSIYESLYSDLNTLTDSPQTKEYRKSCQENIERIILELSRKG
ncbi:MAG: tetratricopeptide repeat protein [Spirochaetota bacterium]|nr:tetratricopeptide repeat protein [Spirochaetota bacterium]